MENQPKTSGVTSSIKESFAGIGEGIQHGAKVLMGETSHGTDEMIKKGEIAKDKTLEAGQNVKDKATETGGMVTDRLGDTPREGRAPGDDPYHNARLRVGGESVLAPEKYSSHLEKSIINEEKPH